MPSTHGHDQAGSGAQASFTITLAPGLAHALAPVQAWGRGQGQGQSKHGNRIPAFGSSAPQGRRLGLGFGGCGSS